MTLRFQTRSDLGSRRVVSRRQLLPGIREFHDTRILFPVPSYDSVVMATYGLLSYWKLGDSGSTAANEVSGGPTGTYTGTTRVTGILPAAPGALATDIPGATSEGVSMGDNYDFAGVVPFSVEVWCVGDALNDAAARTVVGKLLNVTNGGWRLYNDNTSGGRFVFNRTAAGNAANANGRMTGPFIPGTLYHLVGTFDGVAMQLYVNGIPGTAGTLAVTLPNTADNFAVGAVSGFAAGRWDGRISHLSLYNRALSLVEIVQHYKAGMGVR